MTPILSLLLAPVGLQGLAMLFDEFVFHRRRGLPRWERIGHPVDTATVLACYAFVFAEAPTRGAIAAYGGLALVSCAFVTKDEFVHARLCDAREHWLHAVLFLLHPVVLACVGLLWPALHGVPAPWLDAPALVRPALLGQVGIVVAFGAYQAIYWNYWRGDDADSSLATLARSRMLRHSIPRPKAMAK